VTEYIGHINQIAGRLKAEVHCQAPVSISAGVARYPEDGCDAETLLERADERMYELKRRKKSGKVVFDRRGLRSPGAGCEPALVIRVRAGGANGWELLTPATQPSAEAASVADRHEPKQIPDS
jgi:hypothetical protein